MNLNSQRKRLAIAAAGLMVLFGATAVAMSGFPLIVSLPASVHGLSLANYAGPEHPMAPLSPRLVRDLDGQPTAAPTPPTLPAVAALGNPSVAPSRTPATPAPRTSPTPTPSPGLGTVSGQVIDSSNRKALPSVTLTITPGAQTTSTDASGWFAFGGLAPGTYTLTASLFGYQFASFTVTLNGSLRLTIKMTSVSATGTIQGTAKDAATGNPIAGATVVLSPGGMTAVTDANGGFSLNGVPVGTYTLSASATGYLSSNQVVNLRWGKTLSLQLKLVHV